MLIGYARISTSDQSLNLQTDALKKAGCERLYTDTISGAKADRPGLQGALEYARAGDTIVVWKLDRLGRTVKGLIELTESLRARSIGFASLQDQIDTSTSVGQFFFHVISAFAELERNLIRERTQAGLVAARARGKTGGRPFALKGDNRVDAMKLIEAGRDATYVMAKYRVSRSTVDREWKKWQQEKARSHAV